jgi:hypothetical protein
VTLRRRYRSPAEARRLAAALEADQPEDLRWHVRGRVLEFRFDATTPESARATGDDLLAYLSAADRTAHLTSPRPPSSAKATPSDP